MQSYFAFAGFNSAVPRQEMTIAQQVTIEQRSEQAFIERASD
jgi:hypothetical protein